VTPLPCPRAVAAAIFAAGLAAGALAGCSSHDTTTRASSRPTPIAQLNTAAMDIPRIDFCSRIPRQAVTDALDSTKSRLASYRDGDRTAVAGGTDTVAENGCAWLATNSPALARAWIFASPVDRTLARSALRDARTTPGCRLVKSPEFGNPSLTQVCQTRGNIRVRHAGLFGTTWLTCELSDTGTVAAVRARADAWCVQVVNAVNTSR